MPAITSDGRAPSLGVWVNPVLRLGVWYRSRSVCDKWCVIQPIIFPAMRCSLEQRHRSDCSCTHLPPQTGAYAEAAEQYRHVLGEYADTAARHARVWLALAEVEERLDNSSEVISVYERAIDANAVVRNRCQCTCCCIGHYASRISLIG